MPDTEEVVAFLDQSMRLRPLQAGDRAFLEDLCRRSESHDLQMRFFSGFRSLPPSLLDELMRIDPDRRITLVALGAPNRLTAVVLQENTRMLRLAERCGFRREPAELGVTHLALELDSLAA